MYIFRYEHICKDTFSIENKAISHLLKSCKEYHIAFFFLFLEKCKGKKQSKELCRSNSCLSMRTISRVDIETR